MFHVHDGWFFDRQPDGSVRIQKRENARDDAPVVIETVVPPDAWASVMASMSAGGEIDERFYAAKSFHESTGPITITASPHD